MYITTMPGNIIFIQISGKGCRICLYNPNSNDGGATSTNFILGGHGYFCLGGGNFCTQQVWEYYPPADTWSHKRDFPGIYREGASGFIYGNKAYVGLGFSCSQPLRDLWEYDPIGDIWTGVDSIPAQGRFGANVAVIDSYAYFFGGLINNFNYTNEVWRYNIPANIWQHLSNIPGVARAVSICYPLRTTILYGYGATDWPNTAGDMYLYDTQTDQWQPVICNGFLDSIGDGASFIYDHYGYFLGGSTGKWNFKKDLWKFDTADIYRHTDIEQIAVTKGAFQIYPAVLVPGQALRIRSDYSGSIIFYNSLGQEVYKHFFNEELTVIQATDIPHKDGLLFYQAMLKNGPVATGKIILIR